MTDTQAPPLTPTPIRRRVAQPPARPRVVVIGGGFGGLAATRHLARLPVDVTLVDRAGTHTFRPLLYQVGVERLAAADVSRPLSDVLAAPIARGEVELVTASVVDVDRTRRQVRLHDGRALPYDHLVVAAGATSTHLGVPGAAEHALAFGDAEDADRLRGALAPLLDGRTPPCAVAVVGGGPTGVELAGAIAGRARAAGRRDLRVDLIEAGPHLLAGYGPDARERAERSLVERGVHVHLGDPVAEVAGDRVHLESGTELPAALVLWATGVSARPVAAALGLPVAEHGPARGRVPIDATLRLDGHDDVFVVGDLAGAVDGSGALLPQLAPVALQQGTHAAREIGRALRHEPPRAFRYTDKGRLAVVADGVAVADLPGGLDLPGPAAWAVWLAVHALTLPTPEAAAVVTRRWVDAAVDATPAGATVRRALRLARAVTRVTPLGRVLVDAVERAVPPLTPIVAPSVPTPVGPRRARGERHTRPATQAPPTRAAA